MNHQNTVIKHMRTSSLMDSGLLVKQRPWIGDHQNRWELAL